MISLRNKINFLSTTKTIIFLLQIEVFSLINVPRRLNDLSYYSFFMKCCTGVHHHHIISLLPLSCDNTFHHCLPPPSSYSNYYNIPPAHNSSSSSRHHHHHLEMIFIIFSINHTTHGYSIIWLRRGSAHPLAARFFIQQLSELIEKRKIWWFALSSRD